MPILQASRVDKYELELTRLKEKLNELGFYRARVDELRADNSALLDTNQQLSDQLNACHKRIESIVDLENDLLAYKQRIAEYSKVCGLILSFLLLLFSSCWLLSDIFDSSW